jgi:hypothetical protein
MLVELLSSHCIKFQRILLFASIVKIRRIWFLEFENIPIKASLKLPSEYFTFHTSNGFNNVK